MILVSFHMGLLMGQVARDTYAGDRRGSCPLSLFYGGQEGQELPFILFFPSLLSCKRAFSCVVDSLVRENFSGGKVPDPQHIMV